MVATSWENQTVIVEGRPHLLGEIEGGKWYHGTPATLQPGDIVEPGHGHNFKQSPDAMVSISSDLGMAKTWAIMAAREQGGTPHIYEVEPLGQVHAWRMSLANYGKSIAALEARVTSARVTGVV
jgi:Rifampin ADP-ribosyl transferase